MEQSDSARAAENEVIDLWSNILPESLWKNRTGRGVKVAIVDSGIDTEHPALKGKIKESVQAFPENGQIVFKPSTSGDQAGHGTACAGIITSIAPEVEFYSIKVLGPTGSGTGEMFLMGVDYAIKQKMQVVNLSLGTTKRDFWMPMRELLDRAYRERVMLVAAANNLPQLSSPSIHSSSLISVVKRAGGEPFKFGFKYGSHRTSGARSASRNHLARRRPAADDGKQFCGAVHHRNNRTADGRKTRSHALPGKNDSLRDRSA